MSTMPETAVAQFSERTGSEPNASIARALIRDLHAIQAIAYYVEMTIPIREICSLSYLRMLQELVADCEGKLHALLPEARGAASRVSSEECRVAADGTKKSTDVGDAS